MKMHRPAHPGLLLRECMNDKITVTFLAKHLRMSRANLSMILNGKLGISASVALRLGEAFPNQPATLWLGLQAEYDLSRALSKKRKKVRPLHPHYNPAA